MPIPDITALQFLVLALLTGGEIPGRDLRAKLAEQGHRASAPAFYQFMARLEEAGFVRGRYEPKLIDGHLIKQRLYTITGDGVDAWESFRDFALAHGSLRLQGA